MLKNKPNAYLQLHFIVFIWGFTAVIGKLISIEALPLVWYRLFIASIALFIFLLFKKSNFRFKMVDYYRFFLGGLIIGLHWFTFFYAIKISNVSITLITLATGAIFASLLEPIFLKKKIKLYEFSFALLTVIGLLIVLNIDTIYFIGIIIALISAFLSALFSVINAIYIKKYEAKILSFYELFFALIIISIIGAFNPNFIDKLSQIKNTDIIYLIILGIICTAFALVVSNNLLKKISPFTMMLTINLEPVYGIILALLVFGDSEKMEVNFYIGASIILVTVILNGWIKIRQKK